MDAATTIAKAAPQHKQTERAIQRLGAEEHRQLGAEATGGETLEIELGDGTRLTYGEMMAMADFVGSISEIRALAATPAGQAELRWARWSALRTGPEPAVPEDVKARVRDRYYRLAAANYSHFSAGGTALNEYEVVHEEALGLAFFAGASGDTAKWAEARATEAFADHYLSDMFSSAHVRTPRMQMKEWYQERFPDSVDRFVTYAATQITEYLGNRGDIPWYWPDSTVAGRLRGRIIALGGSAVEAYSLGDVVSLAYHNQDNAGLGVVSDLDPQGNEVEGGFRWTARGDNLLAESPITRQMAVAAVSESLKDLDLMRQAGEAASGGTCVPDEQLQPFLFTAVANMKRQVYRAERYIPREDTDANNPSLNWRWGQIDPLLRGAIDRAVKVEIADTLRSKADAVPAVVRFTRRGREQSDGAVELHVREGFLSFCDQLAARGIIALEEAMGTPAVAPSESALDAGVALPAGVPEDPADAGVAEAGAAGVP